MSIVDKYRVTLSFTREIIGTNPIDPAIHDQHIINKQRKLIAELGDKTNREINKYLSALQIPEDREKQELEKILDTLEEIIGKPFTKEERQQAIAGELSDLRQTLAEMELKGTTVFFRGSDGMPCIGDHMIKGFLKAAGETLCRAEQSSKKKTKDTEESAKRPSGFLSSITSTTQAINQTLTVEEQFISFDKDVTKDEKGNIIYLHRSLRAQTLQGPRVTLVKSEVVPAGSKISFTLKVMKNSPITEEGLKKLFSVGEIFGIGQWRNAGYGQFKYELIKVDG